MTESIQSFRQRELQAIYRFISNSHPYELANIVSEIRVCHGLMVFDPSTKTLKNIETVSINGETIQLNAEK
jgi:hypothetical protein